MISFTRAQLTERGAAGLEPRLPCYLQRWNLYWDRLQTLCMTAYCCPYDLQNWVELGFSVWTQGGAFCRVFRQVIKQRRVMECDVWLDAEADMSVEAGWAVLWVEVRGKEKGLPDCVTWKNRKSSFQNLNNQSSPLSIHFLIIYSEKSYLIYPLTCVCIYRAVKLINSHPK